MQFSGTPITFHFVLWTMISLASGAAVSHELTDSAFLQSIATLAAGGALCIGWRDHAMESEDLDRRDWLKRFTTTIIKKNVRDSNDIFT